MSTSLKLAALAAALALGARWAKKAPEQLPPPPMESGTPADTTGDTSGTVGQGVVPGSRADFMQKVTADRVLFVTDSYSLDGQARSVLASQANWLQANPQNGRAPG